MIASAVARMRFSSMLQPNRFQLFHPIGGAVSATTGVIAAAGPAGIATAVAAPVSAASRQVRRRRIVRSFGGTVGEIVGSLWRNVIEHVEYCCTPRETWTQDDAFRRPVPSRSTQHRRNCPHDPADRHSFGDVALTLGCRAPQRERKE